MKKLLATLCLSIGLASASMASTPSMMSVPSLPGISAVEEANDDTPDVIIVIMDDRGVIVDIEVIKNK